MRKLLMIAALALAGGMMSAPASAYGWRGVHVHAHGGRVIRHVIRHRIRHHRRDRWRDRRCYWHKHRRRGVRHRHCRWR